MSRFESPRDIPQRWDRDRFERFGGRGPPPTRFEEDYRYEERDRPFRRDVAVADRIDERGPWGRYEERDRFYEEDRYAPRRPRRRTDRELFGDVDPREIAEMALTPYRRKSISREELDIDRRGPPRPGLLRRQSSLDTFDRRPIRTYEKEEYRIPPYTPVPLPIRRGREEEFEEIRYRDYEPDHYREVEIERERSTHRRKPKSEASRRSHAKSVTTRRSSPSSSSSESFEEIVKEEQTQEIIPIPETERKFKKGKTRMPKRLVRREAIMDLGYPFDEEEDFFVLRIALEKDQIDEVIKVSDTYKESSMSPFPRPKIPANEDTVGPAGTKKVYRFEEKEEEVAAPPTILPPEAAVEHEEVTRTEWVNPPTVVMTGARSERARSIRGGSPSANSSISRRLSPARTHHSHSRRASRAGTVFEERKTVIEESRSPPPPPPPAPIPVPPPAEFIERDSRTIIDHGTVLERDNRTIIEERLPPPSHHGALVVQEREYRSDRDIQAEIRALEAERRALRLEREAEEKRDLALRLREHPEEEYQLVEYREERRPREMLEIVERERSPPRNVIRVEKDRKGRMALVRSSH
jgi:hypothetical protein